MKDPEEFYGSSLVGSALLIVIGFLGFWTIIGVQHFWPETIPFDIFQFWRDNKIVGGVLVSWPVLLWGVVIAIIVAFFFKTEYVHGRSWGIEMVLSMLAGLLEEMSYRWIFFFFSMAVIVFVNFLFLGFMGWDIVQWIYEHIFFLVVNFVSFGALHDQIYSPLGWQAGAALISVNADFRKGHRYLGFFGMWNAWALGLFFFWVVFNYGIVPAIIVHAVYDVIVFSISYIENAIRS